MWLCLSLSYFLLTRSDEMFAITAGVVHRVHCLARRDVAFFSADKQFEYRQWRQADMMETLFRGHKGDQKEEGTVIVRTREETHGPRAGYRAYGGAVALRLELLSRHATLPAHASLCSYRSGHEVKVLNYSEALRALRGVVEKSGP